MAGTPIDLSAFKPEPGQDGDASPIKNAMTAIEAWSASAIDPASMLQKAATTGQPMVWDGTKWAPGTPANYPVAPTMLAPAYSPISSATVTANSAYLHPIPFVMVPTAISRLGFGVASGGGTGNYDVGIYYSDDDATFTRLVSKGSTAVPANGPVLVSVGATTVTPVVGRRWYYAFGCSSGTPTFLVNNASAFSNTYIKGTSFPLPASLTTMTQFSFTVFVYGMV